MPTTPPPPTADRLRRRAESADEPAWLVERRLHALAVAEKLPAPRYDRTDLSGVDLAALFERAEGGRPRVESKAAADGVVVMDLASAARDRADLLQPVLYGATPSEEGALEALANARWTTGTLVHVPRGVEVEEPVVLDVVVGPEGALTHTVVVAEPLSKVSIVQRFRSASDDGPEALVTGTLELVARDGAKVAYAGVQDLGASARHFAVKRASVARDASVTWMDAQFGAKQSRVVVESVLSGPGAATKNLGAFFGAKTQRFDITSSALHRARHTSSDLTTKGALMDRAYAAYYGLVNIGPQAPESSGHQHETTLLLSEDARADSIPKLDVENNNVSASHAAAVGQMDRDQVFYIQSRGLPERAATRVLVEGFFEPLLREIPLESVRDELTATVTRRLS